MPMRSVLDTAIDLLKTAQIVVLNLSLSARSKGDIKTFVHLIRAQIKIKYPAFIIDAE